MNNGVSSEFTNDDQRFNLSRESQCHSDDGEDIDDDEGYEKMESRISSGFANDLFASIYGYSTRPTCDLKTDHEVNKNVDGTTIQNSLAHSKESENPESTLKFSNLSYTKNNLNDTDTIKTGVYDNVVENIYASIDKKTIYSTNSHSKDKCEDIYSTNDSYNYVLFNKDDTKYNLIGSSGPKEKYAVALLDSGNKEHPSNTEHKIEQPPPPPPPPVRQKSLSVSNTINGVTNFMRRKNDKKGISFSPEVIIYEETVSHAPFLKSSTLGSRSNNLSTSSYDLKSIENPTIKKPKFSLKRWSLLDSVSNKLSKSSNDLRSLYNSQERDIQESTMTISNLSYDKNNVNNKETTNNEPYDTVDGNIYTSIDEENSSTISDFIDNSEEMCVTEERDNYDEMAFDSRNNKLFKSYCDLRAAASHTPSQKSSIFNSRNNKLYKSYYDLRSKVKQTIKNPKGSQKHSIFVSKSNELSKSSFDLRFFNHSQDRENPESTLNLSNLSFNNENNEATTNTELHDTVVGNICTIDEKIYSTTSVFIDNSESIYNTMDDSIENSNMPIVKDRKSVCQQISDDEEDSDDSEGYEKLDRRVSSEFKNDMLTAIMALAQGENQRCNLPNELCSKSFEDTLLQGISTRSTCDLNTNNGVNMNFYGTTKINLDSQEREVPELTLNKSNLSYNNENNGNNKETTTNEPYDQVPDNIYYCIYKDLCSTNGNCTDNTEDDIYEVVNNGISSEFKNSRNNKLYKSSYDLRSQEEQTIKMSRSSLNISTYNLTRNKLYKSSHDLRSLEKQTIPTNSLLDITFESPFENSSDNTLINSEEKEPPLPTYICSEEKAPPLPPKEKINHVVKLSNESSFFQQGSKLISSGSLDRNPIKQYSIGASTNLMPIKKAKASRFPILRDLRQGLMKSERPLRETAIFYTKAQPYPDSLN